MLLALNITHVKCLHVCVLTIQSMCTSRFHCSPPLQCYWIIFPHASHRCFKHRFVWWLCSILSPDDIPILMGIFMVLVQKSDSSCSLRPYEAPTGPTSQQQLWIASIYVRQVLNIYYMKLYLGIYTMPHYIPSLII